jgi:glycolate oxidase FAD binding subunit
VDVAGAGGARAGEPLDAVDGVVPAHVVRPRDVAGVQAVLSAATRERRGVLASGLGAHLDVGAPPRALDVLLRTDALDRVLAYEPADMTVTVEAGCSLATLGDALGASGQWLPIDPPRPARTTVGGLVAANLSGPLRASHGTVRDLLIGIAVVGSEGALVRGGGRVVKNVAGYDLPKLHVGALGSLGVIVEVTFKVRPRPPREEAMVIEVPEPAAGASLALDLYEAVEPSWIELVHPASLVGGPAGASCIVVGAAGAAPWVEESMAELQRRAASLPAQRRADGAACRHALADLAARPVPAVLRVATLPTALSAFVVPVVSSLAADGHALDLTAHVASGVARVGVREAASAGTVLARLRREAPPGAVVVVDRAAPAVKAGLDVWGTVPDGRGGALMTALKREIDPGGSFAPGRFVCT